MISVSWVVSRPAPAPNPDSVTEAPADLGARDLLIDPQTRELVVQDGDLVLVRGVEAVRQAIEIRLRTFAGEWFLDLSRGLPYMTDSKPVDLAQWRTRIREEIRGTLGVAEVPRVVVSFEGRTRLLKVDWQARVDTSLLSGTMLVSEEL